MRGLNGIPDQVRQRARRLHAQLVATRPQRFDGQMNQIAKHDRIGLAQTQRIEYGLRGARALLGRDLIQLAPERIPAALVLRILAEDIRVRIGRRNRRVLDVRSPDRILVLNLAARPARHSHVHNAVHCFFPLFLSCFFISLCQTKVLPFRPRPAGMRPRGHSLPRPADARPLRAHRPARRTPAAASRDRTRPRQRAPRKDAWSARRKWRYPRRVQSRSSRQMP